MMDRRLLALLHAAIFFMLLNKPGGNKKMQGLIALACHRFWPLRALLWGAVGVLCAGSAFAGDWHVPDVKTLPDDANGTLIRRGLALLQNTSEYIGSEIADQAMRYAGTNMACESCHLDGGTVKYGLPLVGTAEPIADKINVCMTTSMNGKPLPKDSPEMTALVAYVKFLQASVPASEAVSDRAGKTALPKGDAAKGREILADICVVCHGSNGLGKREGPIGSRKGYVVPPLWGKESWNDGSPFTDPSVLAGFVLNNMPEGVSHESPALSMEEAANAAAFILTAPRPHKQ